MKRFLIFVIVVSMFFAALTAWVWAAPYSNPVPASADSGSRIVRHSPRRLHNSVVSSDVPYLPNRLVAWRELERNLRGPIGAFASCGKCYGIAGHDLRSYAELQRSE